MRNFTEYICSQNDNSKIDLNLQAYIYMCVCFQNLQSVGTPCQPVATPLHFTILTVGASSLQAEVSDGL